MPRIPEEIIEEVRRRSDIVEVVGGYVDLQNRGNDYWACCPFHEEKTPSFHVVPTRQRYHCFGCQKSGDVIRFVMEQENLGFLDAVRLLARRAGIEIRLEDQGRGNSGPGRGKLFEVLEGVCKWYQVRLEAPEGRTARRYLADRGLVSEIVTEFRMGYAPDAWDALVRWGQRRGYGPELLEAVGLVSRKGGRPGAQTFDRFRGRLMLPIQDELGRVVGFSARSLDPACKERKYMNTGRTELFVKRELLFGLHLARKAFREAGHVLLCEGPLDVVACHQAGLTHAVGTQGTAFTQEHARLVNRYADQLTIAFDGDSAGVDAACRCLEIALQVDLTARVVSLSDREDPADILKRSGPEALREAMSNGKDCFEFLLAVAASTHDRNTPMGKTEIVNAMVAALKAIPNPAKQAIYSQWLEQELSLPDGVVLKTIEQSAGDQPTVKNGSGPAQEREGFAPAKKPERMRPDRQARLRSAETCLLDLALHHRAIACRLCEVLNPDLIGNDVVGVALFRVLALAKEGDWEAARDTIVRDEATMSDPTVGRIMTRSAFAEQMSSDSSSPDKCLEQAMQDCLMVLQEHRLREKIETLKEAMLREEDPESLQELMRQYQELLRKRRDGPEPEG